VAKAFSVASWNVEHFKNVGATNEERVAFIAEQDPDVLAIYEVEGAEVWRELMSGLPGYSFFITEGQNAQEILLGTRAGLTAFVTQKIEFQSRDAFMRPGALLTVRIDKVDYTLLFLHVASWPAARGFGLRADMIERAVDFKVGVLDKLTENKTNFIFLGDLNTMGLDYVFGRVGTQRKLRHARVEARQEIARLRFLAEESGMRLLEKTHDVTWRDGGRRRSNLDHVVASAPLSFKKFGGAEVDVRGWPQLADEAAQKSWISRFSDHALLYFEVQKP
jgi:exonuclease III